jgi:asparagine synthase (glutamine-hydrolysing)
MSGFAGVVSEDGAIPETRLLDQMAARLAFRGPDATQVSTQEGVGFCFTLLRAGPGPQIAKQPCSLEGRVWLLGDVRLDGREELRLRLEQQGDSIHAEVTDEELILHAWRQWGEASFERLLGDFAFAIWDGKAKSLWCVRDLLGLRPFFYAHAGKRFFFSNMLEVVRFAPEVSAALDPAFVGDFLLQGFCQDGERTAFRDIRRLPQGHFLNFSDGDVRVRPYAALTVEEPLQLKPAEYVEQFRGLLEQAVRDRLPPGPVAIFMSGGLDSTSVAAHAVRIAKEAGSIRELRAYTADLRPLFEDEEAAYASRTAQHLGIPWEVHSLGASRPYASWDVENLELPEPSNDPFLVPDLEFCRHVSAFTRVVLSGDGGDVVLTGQAWPHLVYLLKQGRFEAIARAFGGYVLKNGRIPPLHGGFRTRLRRLIRPTGAMEGYPAWLNPNFEKEQSLRDRWAELQVRHKTTHPLHPMAHASLNSPYWAHVLEDADAAWTGVPLERRAPLLDLRLVRFLLRVPPVPGCMEKQLLREAMRGVLPNEVVLRKKTPLLREPFEVYTNERGWKPALPVAMEKLGTLREFVDWEKVSATLRNAAGSSLWVDLRPISLHHWLKGVEKDG